MLKFYAKNAYLKKQQLLAFLSLRQALSIQPVYIAYCQTLLQGVQEKLRFFHNSLQPLLPLHR